MNFIHLLKNNIDLRTKINMFYLLTCLIFLMYFCDVGYEILCCSYEWVRKTEKMELCTFVVSYELWGSFVTIFVVWFAMYFYDFFVTTFCGIDLVLYWL